MTRPVQWLLPVDPAAHPEHQPVDWRTRADATAVWEAIARSQDVSRWCLRSGYRTMRPGDRIWAYLSRRQEICAVGRVRAVTDDSGTWSVLVDWESGRSRALARHPVPREEFGQVPMSTCRAGEHAAAVLDDHYTRLGERRIDLAAGPPDRRS